MNPLYPFKRTVPWALVFVAKVLGFVAIIDIAVSPILWILRVAMPQAYILITCFEGFCIVLIGGSMLFTSLFSTIEQANHKHIGLGTYRYGLRSRKLTNEEKSKMRQKGILMVTIGILLFLPTLFPLHMLPLPFPISQNQ